MIVPVVDWIGSGLSAHLLWVVLVVPHRNEFFHLCQKGIKTHEIGLTRLTQEEIFYSNFLNIFNFRSNSSGIWKS
jgi:hypothetical protein